MQEIEEEIISLYKTGYYSKRALEKKFGYSKYKIRTILEGVKSDKITCIAKEFERAGYKLVSKEYVNNREKLEYICPIHGTQYVAWASFKQGNRCPDCYKDRITPKIEYIKDEFNKVGYELITTEYKNSKAKLIYICPEHGKQETTWSRFKQGSRCQECYFDNKSGIYNNTLAIRNKDEWINTPAKLYFVEIRNKSEVFLKIGITTCSMEYRFSSLPYEYREINVVSMNLYNAIHIEEYLLEKYSNYKYKPLIKFSGYTECFNIFIMNKIIVDLVYIKHDYLEAA